MDSLAALLAEAEALDKAATPGPWEWSAKGRGPRRLQESDGGDEIAWASEERGVVATAEGDVRRIEGDSCRVFWFEEGRWFPRWPGAHVGQRVIVSVRLADPTEGG